MKIEIIEHSLLARIAARKLKAQNVALTIGTKIHIYGATKNDLLKNKSWLRHELKHVEQFFKYGFVFFIVLYLMESICKGYYNNRFEIEARNAENTQSVLEKYVEM